EARLTVEPVEEPRFVRVGQPAAADCRRPLLDLEGDDERRRRPDRRHRWLPFARGLTARPPFGVATISRSHPSIHKPRSSSRKSSRRVPPTRLCGICPSLARSPTVRLEQPMSFATSSTRRYGPF